MANTTPSPNMGLPIPVTGTDPGPQYATDVNSCLTLIDSHNHTSNSGVPVPSAGININADLPYGGNNATGVRSVRFNAQAATLSGASDIGCVYVSGVDMYYNDVNGNKIRITSGGAVAGTPGSISNLASPASATYVAGSGTFVFQQNTNTAGNMDVASIILRNTTAGSNGITISPPAALGANYSLTLPSALPGSKCALVIDTSGNISPLTASSGISAASADAIGQAMDATGANAVANTRTRATGTTVAAGGVAVSAAFTWDVTGTTTIVGSEVTITTTGRPVMLTLIGNLGGNAEILCTSSVWTKLIASMEIKNITSASDVCLSDYQMSLPTGGSGSQNVVNYFTPTIACVDFPAAGTYTYGLVVSGTAKNGATNESYECLSAPGVTFTLVAYEI